MKITILERIKKNKYKKNSVSQEINLHQKLIQSQAV